LCAESREGPSCQSPLRRIVDRDEQPLAYSSQ
jgi:hypothetical protein